MENKFDTQFLIEGHDLDEDAIHDGILNSAYWSSATRMSSRCITTPTPRGRFWSTPPPSAN